MFETPITGNYQFKTYYCLECGACVGISFIPQDTEKESFCFDGRKVHEQWHDKHKTRRKFSLRLGSILSISTGE